MNVEIQIESTKERDRPRNSEVERLWADNSKAKELYGWSPTYAGMTGFSRGLENTITWFSNPINLASYKSQRYNI
jgi:dTDP-glucose 4,6-dehydratase